MSNKIKSKDSELYRKHTDENQFDRPVNINGGYMLRLVNCSQAVRNLWW